MQPAILIAEDTDILFTGMRCLFDIMFGYTNLTRVTAGQELLVKLREKEFTHLILDIGLRDGCSLDVLPEIRQICPSLKIVLHSADPMPVHQGRFEAYNISAYIFKGRDVDSTMEEFRAFLIDEVPA